MADVAKNRVEHLVVDAAAFMRNVHIQDMANKVYTCQAVLNEIRDKRTRQALQVLPYELIMREPQPENLKIVSEFSKKTGDYTTLSATDIRVIALTYELQKQYVGKESFKEEPVIRYDVRNVVRTPGRTRLLPGFFHPEHEQGSDNMPKNSQISDNDVIDTNDESDDITKVDEEGELTTYLEIDKEVKNVVTKEDDESGKEEQRFDDDKLEEEEKEDDIIEAEEEELYEFADAVEEYKDDEEYESAVEEQDEDYDDDDYENDDLVEQKENIGKDHNVDDDDDDEVDDVGWINKSNINKVIEQLGCLQVIDVPTSVACLTTDFPMQNTLIQMGMNVVSVDGMLIRRVRRCILRCYACFKTTNITTKLFCPHCGNKTLKRVSVLVDGDNGTKRVSLNFWKPINVRGLKKRLPPPKGGKHARNPIVCADQPMGHRRFRYGHKEKFDDVNLGRPSGSLLHSKDLYNRATSFGITDQLDRFNRRYPDVISRRRKQM